MAMPPIFSANAAGLLALGYVQIIVPAKTPEGA
jgi:hypothetical protein